ncbi:unnamed protein product [Larinioides sclopetarius]|uniref:Uncharacterized protein n=1 Tax=Larinioides sclopetarius TaxID=280406 RepID=A0AAV1YT02_9ARAC
MSVEAGVLETITGHDPVLPKGGTHFLQKDLQIGKRRIGTFRQPVGSGVAGHVTPPAVRVRVRVILLEVLEAGNARVGTSGKGLSRRFWNALI